MKKSIRINALLNVIKQIMQVLFPLVSVPYITRVLLPENYGKINTGNSLISYISLIAGLGIATYAIREGSLVRDNEIELNDFSSQIFSINILSTGIAYCILAVIVFLVPHYSQYRILLIIQGTTVFFTTIGVDWINSIKEDYLYLTIRYIILHIMSLVLMFIFVKKPEDYYLYAIISLVTSVGANIMNIFYVRKYVKIRFTFKINWKRHLSPIMILFGNAIAMTIYVSSDITMLEIFKGATEVGIYSVAAKIYSIIKQILNAILTVSIPRLTVYMGSGESEKFNDLGRKVINSILTLMFPLVIGIIVFRSEAIFYAGGSEYLDGKKSLLILILAVAFSLPATFFSGCVLMCLRKENYIFQGTMISAVLNVALNFIFIPLWGSIGAALTTLISEMFVAIYFWLLVKRAGYRFLDKKVIVLSLFGSIMIGVFAIVMKKVFNNFAVCFTLSLVGSIVLYSIIHIIGKNPVVTDLIHIKRVSK